jgi:hypothetical protein
MTNAPIARRPHCSLHPSSVLGEVGAKMASDGQLDDHLREYIRIDAKRMAMVRRMLEVARHVTCINRHVHSAKRYLSR